MPFAFVQCARDRGLWMYRSYKELYREWKRRIEKLEKKLRKEKNKKLEKKLLRNIFQYLFNNPLYDQYRDIKHTRRC